MLESNNGYSGPVLVHGISDKQKKSCNNKVLIYKHNHCSTKYVVHVAV